MRYLKTAEVMVGKAEQKFKLAEFSLSSELYDSCVSALYYSAFQYVTALILARGEKVSNKHTYVRGWVNRNLGVSGLLSVELVKLYNRLMDHRAEADYSTTVSFSKEDVAHLVEQVRTFNQAIIKIIEQEATNI